MKAKTNMRINGKGNFNGLFASANGSYKKLAFGLAILLFIAFGSALPSYGIMSISVNTTEDSFISSSNPDTNYNSANQLRVGIMGDFPGNKQRTYLKYQIPDTVLPEDVLDAVIYINRMGGNGNTKVNAYIAPSSWTEAGITWNNAPSPDLTAANFTWMNNSTGVNGTTWNILNVTSVVKQKLGLDEHIISFALKGDDLVYNNYQLISSHESSSYFGPQLLIRTKGSESDITPPNSPLNLTAHYAGGNIILKWQSPAGESVAQYKIYASDGHVISSFGFLTPIGNTSLLTWTDGSASLHQKRFYIVRAEDAAGNQEGNTIIVGKFDIPISSGWNLVSFPLNITAKQLGAESELENPLPTAPGDCIVSLWRHQATGFESTDYYASYGWYPTLSPSFTALENGRGYWLSASKQCTLTVTGKLPSQVSQHLLQSWNLFGWYSLNSQVLGNITSNIDPISTVPLGKLQSAWRYGAGFESTDYYAGYGWYPTMSPAFTNIEPGRGYWLLASSACDITTGTSS